MLPHPVSQTVVLQDGTPGTISVLPTELRAFKDAHPGISDTFAVTQVALLIDNERNIWRLDDIDAPRVRNVVSHLIRITHETERF